MPRSKAHGDLAAMAVEMRKNAEFLTASADAIDHLLPTLSEEDARRLLALKDTDEQWTAPPDLTWN